MLLLLSFSPFCTYEPTFQIHPKLAKTSQQVYRAGEPLKSGQKYYSYDYDGSISMVSVTNLDGTTSYYVAYVVNQTVTEKTL